MRALVIGGDSKLGKVLVERLERWGHSVVVTTRREWVDDLDAPGYVHLDLLDPGLPQEVADDPGQFVVYIMAAITGVVPAEVHPDAWRVNAEAPLVITLQAQARGWHVVFMSSGTVERAPHTASAMQKRYVEPFVLMKGGCVVRPLPTVPQEKYVEVADILVGIGELRTSGVVRWEG